MNGRVAMKATKESPKKAVCGMSHYLPLPRSTSILIDFKIAVNSSCLLNL